VLYLSWACSWAKTWSLTIFRFFNLYTPLHTVVRVVNAARSITPCQAADAILTAGAILLPDIALVLTLIAAVISACAFTILSEFYSPCAARGKEHRGKHRRPSPIQQWIVRSANDLVAWATGRLEAFVGSISTRRRTKQRHQNLSGNTARSTAWARVARLSRCGMAIKRYPSAITELENALVNDRRTTTTRQLVMVALYKSRRHRVPNLHGYPKPV
jgi:hypothetical protein